MAVSTVKKTQTIKALDITTGSNGVRRLDEVTNDITIGNVLNGIVLDSNNYAAVFYTYSNLLYVAVKARDTMANVTGTFRVRVFYFN